MLRDAGAAEVHLRISSPPFRWPCFYGIDTPNRAELLAAQQTLPEIEQFLDVDSLAYISLENLKAAIDAPGAGLLRRLPDRALPGGRPGGPAPRPPGPAPADHAHPVDGQPEVEEPGLAEVALQGALPGV